MSEFYPTGWKIVRSGVIWEAYRAPFRSFDRRAGVRMGPRGSSEPLISRNFWRADTGNGAPQAGDSRTCARGPAACVQHPLGVRDSFLDGGCDSEPQL